MAATVRKFLRPAAGLLCIACFASADQAADVLNQISSVATALSAGNAAEAMEPFDKSLPNYDQLQNDLVGLTAAYKLQNEIDVTEEKDSADEADVTVRWVMTVETNQTNSPNQRTADIRIKLARKGKKWRITSFSPIDLFDPTYR